VGFASKISKFNSLHLKHILLSSNANRWQLVSHY